VLDDGVDELEMMRMKVGGVGYFSGFMIVCSMSDLCAVWINGWNDTLISIGLSLFVF